MAEGTVGDNTVPIRRRPATLKERCAIFPGKGRGAPTRAAPVGAQPDQNPASLAAFEKASRPRSAIRAIVLNGHPGLLGMDRVWNRSQESERHHPFVYARQAFPVHRVMTECAPPHRAMRYKSS